MQRLIAGGKENTKFVYDGQDVLVDDKHLHVDVDSRSSLASSDLARRDLEQLGARKIAITRGEFSLKNDPTLEFVTGVLIIAALALVFVFWLRKQ